MNGINQVFAMDYSYPNLPQSSETSAVLQQEKKSVFEAPDVGLYRQANETRLRFYSGFFYSSSTASVTEILIFGSSSGITVI